MTRPAAQRNRISPGRTACLGLCLCLAGILQVSAQTPTNLAAATDEKVLLRKIEEAESQLVDAQLELDQLRTQQKKTQKQLDQQAKREKDLKDRMLNLKQEVGKHRRRYEIYHYNLTKKFPRQRQELTRRLTEMEDRDRQTNRVLKQLLRDGIDWPEPGFSGNRYALLSRTLLRRCWPALLNQKREADQEREDLRLELGRIEQLVELDEYLIGGNIAGQKIQDRNHKTYSEKLNETARRRRFAEEEIQQSESKIKALETLVAEIEKRLPLLRQGIDYKSFTEQKGRLFWPVSGRIVHEFGTRKHPEFDLKINNSGIDLASVPGQEVRAAADGWVVFSGTLPGYGPLIMLHHGANYFTFYAPVKSVGLETEQRVTLGQVIGRVESTPNEAGSSLHFEIRHGSKALDPDPWLQ